MEHSEVQHHVRVYVSVFVALLVLTLLTVAVSYLHLPIGYAVLIALIVAGVKGTLVAGNFMHLFKERKVLYWALALTVVFFFVLMFVPMMAFMDPIVYKHVP